MKKRTTLLAIPQIDSTADHVSGSRVCASTMLSAADANIRPAHTNPKAWVTSGTNWIAFGGR
jgi:hypothetical protein